MPGPAPLASSAWPPRPHHSPPRSGWPASASKCPCSRTTFDPASLQERLTALESEMGAPGFWDEPEAAAKTGAEHTRTQRRLDAFTRLQSDAEDLEGLVELADEDPDLASELEEAFASVESRLAALEEERLFSGKYDAGDALVPVNAGAGGTAAQDPGMMVLRMMM